MVLGLSLAGGLLFLLAYLGLRTPGIDRKRAGLRAANRFRPTLVSAHRAETQERE